MSRLGMRLLWVLLVLTLLTPGALAGGTVQFRKAEPKPGNLDIRPSTVRQAEPLIVPCGGDADCIRKNPRIDTNY